MQAEISNTRGEDSSCGDVTPITFLPSSFRSPPVGPQVSSNFHPRKSRWRCRLAIGLLLASTAVLCYLLLPSNEAKNEDYQACVAELWKGHASESCCDRFGVGCACCECLPSSFAEASECRMPCRTRCLPTTNVALNNADGVLLRGRRTLSESSTWSRPKAAFCCQHEAALCHTAVGHSDNHMAHA